MFEWDEEQPSPSRARPVIIGATVIVLAALGWFVVRPALTGDDDAASDEPTVVDTSEAAPVDSIAVASSSSEPSVARTNTTEVASGAATTDPETSAATTDVITTESDTTETATAAIATVDVVTTAVETTEGATTEPAPATEAATGVESTSETATTDLGSAELASATSPLSSDPTGTAPAPTEPATTEPATTEPATTEPATTEPATGLATTGQATTESAAIQPATTEPTTTEPADTELATTTTSTAAPTTTPAGGPYETTPDGNPVPVVVILDDDRITLSGAVPSPGASEALVGLALANSQFPNLAVDNRLTINPNVPPGVGVRVLELNSVRFGEGSAEISPEHALQFDRVAAIMNAFPNVSVVVVGHADQRGDEATNLVLGQRRADAVVAYLVSLGVDGARLSARSVGEADLITIDDDEASLELNRRTEFIIYGVLVPPPDAPAVEPPPTSTSG